MNPAVINDPIGAVLQTALLFDGIREHEGFPPNRGIVVDFMNWWIIRDVNEYPLGGQGAPWCATFVNTIGSLALGEAWPIPVEPKYCDVDNLHEWATENKVLKIQNEKPKRGDLFIIRNHRTGDWVHTGFVNSPTGSDAHFETIEGNTNDDGSREGNGVYIRRRAPGVYMAFIRWAEVL